MSKTMTFAMLVGLVVMSCGQGMPEAGDEPQVATTEQGLTSFLTAPKNYYYTSGGTTWFQDSFSGKWCTGATAQAGIYDYNTGCSWTGWLDSSYHQYCDGKGAFWQNSYYHYHCP